MLVYCATHERGLIPGAYDWHKRCQVPDTWHGLSRAAVRQAWQLAQAGGCAGQIVLMAVACDRCKEGACE